MLRWTWRGNTLVRLQARQVPTAKKYEWVLRVSIGLSVIWWTQWGSVGHNLLNWPIIKGGLDSKISLRTVSLREPGRPLVTTLNPITLFTRYYCHCNSFVFPLARFCFLIVDVGQMLGQHRANRPVLGFCGYPVRQYRVEVRLMTGCIFIAACPFCSQAEGQWYSHWGNTLSCSNVRSPADINCASTLAEVLWVYKFEQHWRGRIWGYRTTNKFGDLPLPI